MTVSNPGEQQTRPDQDAAFEHLLAYLKDTRGFEFDAYKRPSLMRRVRHAMHRAGVADFEQYFDYLQVHPDEFGVLFNTILINVTSFFRDSDVWDRLQATVLPELLDRLGPDGAIRVWSAGCATGQETYSIAMLLAELIGIEEFCQRVKIYGTDVDEDALTVARQAVYTEHEIADVPPELREKYFEPVGSRFLFHKSLRRCIIFGRNDLVQDAPIGRLDILLCRNTLMYFTAEAQERMVAHFAFALKPERLLCLGKAEMLISNSAVFEPLDLKRRMFRRTGPRVPLGDLAADPWSAAPAASGTDPRQTLNAAAFLTSPVAQIVLDAEERLRLVNNRAGSLLRLVQQDVGRLFRDLELSYRPVELRSHLDEVSALRSGMWVRDVEWFRSPEERLFLDIEIVPLRELSGAPIGVTLAFHDVTRFRRLQEELQASNRQLESAYQELQSTNEELETTNEELQSTVEELETTNEELQSTNEELETMNEELQSMNDELQSSNGQLRARTDEIEALNRLRESILESLDAAVIVVDADLRVQVWNRQAEDLWGLREDEVRGERLLDMDTQMPRDVLRTAIREIAVRGGPPQTVKTRSVNRRGRPVELTVSVLPLRAHGEPDGGALLLMDASPADGSAAPPAQ